MMVHGLNSQLRKVLLRVFHSHQSLLPLFSITFSKKSTQTYGYDDGIGGAPILMVYVDDTNALVPLEDVKDFLRLFNKYGNPLGAILNLSKTKILTSTKGAAPIATRLSNSMIDSERQAGLSLSRVFKTYLEETHGLRVLGVPLGSPTFCTQFIKGIMERLLPTPRPSLTGSTVIKPHSDMATAFNLMVEDVLSKLTNRDSVPSHSVSASSAPSLPA